MSAEDIHRNLFVKAESSFIINRNFLTIHIINIDISFCDRSGKRI
jgi:hypothetical protein